MRERSLCDNIKSLGHFFFNSSVHFNGRHIDLSNYVAMMNYWDLAKIKNKKVVVQHWWQRSGMDLCLWKKSKALMSNCFNQITLSIWLSVSFFSLALECTKVWVKSLEGVSVIRRLAWESSLCDCYNWSHSGCLSRPVVFLRFWKFLCIFFCSNFSIVFHWMSCFEIFLALVKPLDKRYHECKNLETKCGW